MDVAITLHQGQCYSLDLEWPPRPVCRKLAPQSVALLWSREANSGAWWRLGTWSTMRGSWCAGPFLSFSLFAVCDEVSGFPLHTPTVVFPSTTDPNPAELAVINVATSGLCRSDRKTSDNVICRGNSQFLCVVELVSCVLIQSFISKDLDSSHSWVFASLSRRT